MHRACRDAKLEEIRALDACLLPYPNELPLAKIVVFFLGTPSLRKNSCNLRCPRQNGHGYPGSQHKIGRAFSGSSSEMFFWSAGICTANRGQYAGSRKIRVHELGRCFWAAYWRYLQGLPWIKSQAISKIRLAAGITTGKGKRNLKDCSFEYVRRLIKMVQKYLLKLGEVGNTQLHKRDCS